MRRHPFLLHAAALAVVLCFYAAADQVGAAHLLEHLLLEVTDPRDDRRVGPAPIVAPICEGVAHATIAGAAVTPD